MSSPEPSNSATRNGIPDVKLDGDPVPSPCVNLCRIDPASGLCAGCWRSLDEIAAWSRMSDADKRQVWQALALRRAQWPMPPQHPT